MAQLIHSAKAQANILKSQTDNEIDTMVYELCGLSNKERKVMEGFTK